MAVESHTKWLPPGDQFPGTKIERKWDDDLGMRQSFRMVIRDKAYSPEQVTHACHL